MKTTKISVPLLLSIGCLIVLCRGAGAQEKVQPENPPENPVDNQVEGQVETQNPPGIPQPPPTPPPVDPPVPPNFPPNHVPRGGRTPDTPQRGPTTPAGDSLVPEIERSFEPGLPDLESWLLKLQQIDARLRDQKPKKAAKRLFRLVEEISSTGGDERTLRPLMAEVSLLRAIADAQQGLWDRAEWRFHTALNLSPDIIERDLSTYGESGQWLSSRALRLEGASPGEPTLPRLPAAEDQPPIGAYTLPQPTHVIPPPVGFNNPDSPWRRIQPAHRIEVVVSRWGEVSHPHVSAADLVHPMMVYWVLEALWHAAPFEAAQIDGERQSVIYDMDLEVILPWVGRANARW